MISGHGRKSLGTVVLILLAILVPFISWARVLWLEGAFSALLLLAFLLYVHDVHRERSFRFPSVALWIPFLILFLFALFHLSVSPVPYFSAIFIIHLAVAMVWYFLLLVSADDLPVLTVTLAWVIVLVAWMLGERIWVGNATPSGPFLNPNYTATVLLPCLGYFIGTCLFTDISRSVKTICILAAAISAAGLLLTGSRSALLGLLILLIIFSVSGTKKIRWVSIAVVMVLLLIPTTVRYRILEGYKKDPHAFIRIQIWESAIRMGLDHPFVGVGPNLFYDNSPRYAFRVEKVPVKYGRIARKPHNEYIRSWAEGGVIGIVIVFMFLFFSLRLSTAAWKEGRAGPVLALGMVLFQAFFHDITEVFAPVLLGVWWLAQLTPGGTMPIEPVGRKVLSVLTVLAVFLFGITLWINLNGVSRISWQKGQELMESDIFRASKKLETAQALNPLHPGVARDLARAMFNLYSLSPTSENRTHVEAAILKAKALNHLDTVPLRVQAALFEKMARDDSNSIRNYMEKALISLENAAHLEPFNALILFQQAGYYEELGNLEKALELVDRAIEMEPNYMEAHRTRIRYLAVIDPSMVPDAERQLDLSKERVAGFRPLSSYEEIILR